MKNENEKKELNKKLKEKLERGLKFILEVVLKKLSYNILSGLCTSDRIWK